MLWPSLRCTALVLGTGLLFIRLLFAVLDSAGTTVALLACLNGFFVMHGHTSLDAAVCLLQSPRVGAAVWCIFRRVVASCFAVAFASLLAELRGLIGAAGLYPCAQTVARLGADFGPSALLAYFPSLLHMTGAGDCTLLVLCACGFALSLAVALGLAVRQLRTARWPFAVLFVAPFRLS